MKSERNKQTTANELIREKILRIEKKTCVQTSPTSKKRIKYWFFFAYFCPLENSSKGKPDLGVDLDHLYRITLKIEDKADPFFTPFGQARVQIKGLIAQHTPFSIRW